jgi:hypothetical protein
MKQPEAETAALRRREQTRQEHRPLYLFHPLGTTLQTRPLRGRCISMPKQTELISSYCSSQRHPSLDTCLNVTRWVQRTLYRYKPHKSWLRRDNKRPSQTPWSSHGQSKEPPKLQPALQYQPRRWIAPTTTSTRSHALSPWLMSRKTYIHDKSCNTVRQYEWNGVLQLLLTNPWICLSTS